MFPEERPWAAELSDRGPKFDPCDDKSGDGLPGRQLEHAKG